MKRKVDNYWSTKEQNDRADGAANYLDVVSTNFLQMNDNIVFAVDVIDNNNNDDDDESYVEALQIEQTKSDSL
jgi:hypothetical protein